MCSFAAEPPQCPIVEAVSTRHVGVGLGLALLHPNHLDDFDRTLTVFGPTIAFPFGSDLIQLQGRYGSDSGLSGYLLELSYRLNVPNPFLRAFIEVGGHTLHYTLSSQDHSAWGGNAGVGGIWEFFSRVEVSFTGKMYWQERWIVALGGGFAVFL